jgi:hypothetical protein
MEEAITSPIIKRPIRRPFFLLHTPDRIGSYLQKENFRVVMSKRERLSAFLAPATLVETGTDARGRALQEISYDLSQHLQDAVQMDYLPESVVTAFEQAVTEFCAQSGRITDYELKLRQGFRLPDPDLDPQAYIVYGPVENRQLLILWGAENKQDSSLPLVKPYGYDGPTIAEKLRSRVMGVASKRMEAIKIIDRSNHPISRFMATEVRDAGGVVQELQSMGRRFPMTSVKRLKHLPKSEIEAFGKAASQYYAEAYPESAAITPYEKELRTALRLPDPKISPQSYYISGGRLLIVNSPSDNYDRCLQLKTDTILGIPAPKIDAAGRQIVQSTILDELTRRATPVKLYATIITASVVAVIGLSALGYALMDTNPPEIAVTNGSERKDAIFTSETVNGRETDTPTKIRINWTEPLLRDDFGTDACNTFFFLSEGSRVFKLAKPVLSEDGKTVTLNILPPNNEDANPERNPGKLEDGKVYKLKVTGIKDASLRKNVIPETTKNFVYFDTMPPEVVKAGAEGTDSHKVVVQFNEELTPASATVGSFYNIENPDNTTGARFVVNKVEYSSDPNPHVVLSCDKIGAASDDFDCFTDGNSYVLKYYGICDVSKNDNGRGNSVQKEKNFEFIYKDDVPPTIKQITPTEQTRLNVVFAEKISGKSVEDIGVGGFSIDIVNRDDAKVSPDYKVEVKNVEALKDGRTVILTTSPLRRESNGKSIKYQASAYGISDMSKSGNTIKKETPARATFNYTGPEDSTPPKIKLAKAPVNDKGDLDSSCIEITFDEPVFTKGNLKDCVTVYSSIGDEPLTLSSVQTSGADPKKIIIAIANPPKDTEARAFVVCTKLSDEMGNTAETVKSDLFAISRSSTNLQGYLRGIRSKIIDDSTIELVFDKKLNKDAAEKPYHYYFSGDALVKSAKLSHDPNGAESDIVTLKLSAPEAKEGQYTVKASGLCINGDESIQAVVTFKPSR